MAGAGAGRGLSARKGILLSRGGGTIVQRGEGASFGPREWGLTTMDRYGWECDI